MTKQSELLLERWRSSVLNRVVARVIDYSRKALLSLLAGIGAVPDVVHVCIESVVKEA